ncbi:MAG: ribonuclease H-like domain-containing protein [Eubacteriales bacterium]
MYTKTIILNNKDNIKILDKVNINSKDLLIFDIETTGFSRERSIIYLIGCIYSDSNSWYLKQWLCESLSDEKKVIQVFLDFSNKFNTIFHYNGDSFDIPFIEYRSEKHKLDSKINNIYSYDVYKNIKPYKTIFGLTSLKLKKIETFFNIKRNDLYSGKELIGYFYHFVKTNNLDLREKLLLHNEDDLKGLFNLIPILQYIYLFKDIKQGSLLDNYSIYKNDDYLNININHNYLLPKPINYKNKYFSLDIKEKSILIKISIIKDELKHFFSDYKNYYYLPKEDQAIHKSVGLYVTPSRREKAKASNCYIKKRGAFIPAWNKLQTSTFKKYYNDPMYYIDIEEILNNTELLSQYLIQLLHSNSLSF